MSATLSSPTRVVNQKCIASIISACLVLAMICFKYYDQKIHSNYIKGYVATSRQKREISQPIYNYKGTEAFLISTPGCYIPNYMKKIVFKEASYLNGSCGQRAIFVNKIQENWKNITLIFKIDREKLQNYLRNVKKFECCYSFALRSDVSDHEDDRIRYTKCKRFRSGSRAALQHETIVVKCFSKDILSNKTKPSILYEDAYVFVKKIPRKWMNYNDDSWNVLLVGIDTMSRARIISSMPRLVKKLQEQGWLDYKGYQKIATNTFPNVVSLLTGKKTSTIDNECKPDMYTCNDLMAWSKFRKVGYTTAFGEDFVKLPDTFSSYNGFKKPPTQHYMKPFFLTGEKQRGNVVCAKHRPSAKHIFDYAYDFTMAYAKEKFFGIFWINTISHNNDFLPSLFEDVTINFFDKLRSSGVLYNTFIILFSDHGIRFGENRFQMESFYEERLPMLFIWVPIGFQRLHEKKYYNMQLNQNRLITPYDIYLTLMKISDMSRRSSDIVSEACPSCSNLFKEIAPSRTCADAGVGEKWCSCHSMKNADTFRDLDALNSVHLAVSYIQNYTLTVETIRCRACYPILLHRIFRVHSYINQKNQKNYVVAFQMVADIPSFMKGKRVPPKMSYEVTVLKENNKLTIIGGIDKIESYKSDIYCVKHWRDRGLCICKYVNCYTL